MSLEESLRRVLNEGRDWQRVPVKGAPGVFVLKAPASKNRPATLIVELNPVGPDGSPRKRRGLMLRSPDELEEFRRLLSNPRLDELLRAVERVNPQGVGGDLEV